MLAGLAGLGSGAGFGACAGFATGTVEDGCAAGLVSFNAPAPMFHTLCTRDLADARNPKQDVFAFPERVRPIRQRSTRERRTLTSRRLAANTDSAPAAAPPGLVGVELAAYSLMLLLLLQVLGVWIRAGRRSERDSLTTMHIVARCRTEFSSMSSGRQDPLRCRHRCHCHCLRRHQTHRTRPSSCARPC